jgi:hypothetical protein
LVLEEVGAGYKASLCEWTGNQILTTPLTPGDVNDNDAVYPFVFAQAALKQKLAEMQEDGWVAVSEEVA